MNFLVWLLYQNLGSATVPIYDVLIFICTPKLTLDVANHRDACFNEKPERFKLLSACQKSLESFHIGGRARPPTTSGHLGSLDRARTADGHRGPLEWTGPSAPPATRPSCFRRIEVLAGQVEAEPTVGSADGIASTLGGMAMANAVFDGAHQPRFGHKTLGMPSRH